MASRIPLLAGNWKMNLDHLEATYFVQKLVWLLRDARFDYSRCEIALMPSFTSLRSVQVLVEADKLKIRYGAQAVSVTTQGAFTGDVSADMIAHLAARTSSSGIPNAANTIRRRRQHCRSGACRIGGRHAADTVRRRKLRGTPPGIELDFAVGQCMT